MLKFNVACVQAGKIHREYQSELREQLKRQTDSHNQLLSDALSTQVQSDSVLVYSASLFAVCVCVCV